MAALHSSPACVSRPLPPALLCLLQVVGAILGSAFLYGTIPNSSESSLGSNSVSTGVSNGNAFLGEVSLQGSGWFSERQALGCSSRCGRPLMHAAAAPELQARTYLSIFPGAVPAYCLPWNPRQGAHREDALRCRSAVQQRTPCSRPTLNPLWLALRRLPCAAVLVQAVMTFVLVSVVLETAVSHKSLTIRQQAPLAIGFAVFTAHAVGRVQPPCCRAHMRTCRAWKELRLSLQGRPGACVAPYWLRARSALVWGCCAFCLAGWLPGPERHIIELLPLPAHWGLRPPCLCYPAAPAGIHAAKS
jgi:hypothetical protein